MESGSGRQEDQSLIGEAECAVISSPLLYMGHLHPIYTPVEYQVMQAGLR